MILRPTTYNLRTDRSGFTLVELLVAITLFSLAVAVAVGGFVRALRTQRQIVALVSANSNASLAIEQMAREIRTGNNFGACANPCSQLRFQNANKENVTYFFDEQNGSLDRVIDTGAPEAMTAANIKIHYVNFWLLNDPKYPPRITASLGIGGTDPSLEGNVTNIQTTVSSRAF